MRKSKDKIQKSPRTLGKPRKKIRNFINRKQFLVSIIGIFILLSGVSVFWSYEPKDFNRVILRAKWEIVGLTMRLGFFVEDILVVGRKQTPRAELLKAVRLSRGAPIFTFDIDAARDRVEGLPWVRNAQIERILPNTILLKVKEREPLALWQHQGQFALIDNEGTVILREDLERFSDLVVVVGEGAQKRAGTLIEALGGEPELLAMVEAAVWVGGRRWNVRLKGNIDIRLPEKNPKRAWARLAEYERTHRILERDIQVLDLRLPDRLIVRKSRRSIPIQKKGERET